MAAEVPGRVIEVPVSDNQAVENNALLFRIDPRPYEIAGARLAAAGQTVGASTAAVVTAEARVAEALAARDNTREQAGRVLELVRRNVYPRARGDDAAAKLAGAEAALQAAISELERARQQLGPSGRDNPQVQEASAALQKAQLDLVRTSVTAPGAGVVTNLQLSPGLFVGAGQPALTFIDTRAVWITAMLRENSLGYVRPGTEAEVVFDALPGRVFRARVESLSWGVGGTSGVDQGTGLPTPPPARSNTRRFPVLLVLQDQRPPGSLRYGSQATVVLYAGGVGVTDLIGAAWIRVVSLLTYLS
jgi:multidrug resistance efflux pump